MFDNLKDRKSSVFLIKLEEMQSLKDFQILIWTRK